MAPPPRFPAALLDDLIEEVLVRIPPEDPARLLRAAFVCKRWCRIVSEPGFRRRFCEFHRTPPMLGFLSNFRTFSSFVPTLSFRPPRAAHCDFTAVDARHGRVLLHSAPWHKENPMDTALVLWDPITGAGTDLPLLPRSYYPHSWNAAVLCAPLGACDHLDCHRGGRPFLVVFVGSDEEWGMFSYVYSSEAAAWSQCAYYAQHPHPGAAIGSVPSALVGNALYFVLSSNKSIIEYDLGTRQVSLIDLPTECFSGRKVLITTEEGGLGFANVVNYKLCLWLREAGPDSDAGWVQSRVIDLRALLPNEALSTSLHVAGFAYGIGVIFLQTHVGIFTIDLKSCRVAKVYEDGGCFGNVPYVSFYTPALRAASTEGPSTGTSIA